MSLSINKGKQLVQQFRAQLESIFNEPVEVILFGSFAREEHTADSDIDLLVILQSLGKSKRDLVFDIAWEIGFEAGVVFSVIPLARKDLAALQASPFLDNVYREGIRV